MCIYYLSFLKAEWLENASSSYWLISPSRLSTSHHSCWSAFYFLSRVETGESCGEQPSSNQEMFLIERICVNLSFLENLSIEPDRVLINTKGGLEEERELWAKIDSANNWRGWVGGGGRHSSLSLQLTRAGPILPFYIMFTGKLELIRPLPQMKEAGCLLLWHLWTCGRVSCQTDGDGRRVQPSSGSWPAPGTPEPGKVSYSDSDIRNIRKREIMMRH